jgi:hypothetical protein
MGLAAKPALLQSDRFQNVGMMMIFAPPAIYS